MYRGVRASPRQLPLAGRATRLGAGVLSVIAFLYIVYRVLVRWLGGSFGFFCVGMCGCKKYKCATKCVG